MSGLSLCRYSKTHKLLELLGNYFENICFILSIKKFIDVSQIAELAIERRYFIELFLKLFQMTMLT
jgi:hypothetical protein